MNKDIANGWLLLKEKFQEECLRELNDNWRRGKVRFHPVAGPTGPEGE
jgi:hypothetical protein